MLIVLSIYFQSETPSRLEQKIKRNANFVNYHRGNQVEEKCVEKLKCLVSGTSLPIKLRSNSFLDQSQAEVANAGNLKLCWRKFWSIRNFSKKYETKLSPIACTKAAIPRKQ